MLQDHRDNKYGFLLAGGFLLALVAAPAVYAGDAPESYGAQAGTAAREVKDAANEGYSTGAMKVAETSRKVEANVQEAWRTLQAQWDALAKDLQVKTKELQQQLAKQWQDFNKSFFPANPQPSGEINS